ncbi:GFA family protein [Sulfitobacter sp. D35]|uniref:GFA family protein n=1 Tax=Sulfitobacter sp. D35 TaxID=3083252 RepID=UPI00296F2F67|nr:GFA family protein [Sulfitobacter sp. D35]MDW4496762.1 GFA family protein [Sulfitobacter sp. D35]
MSDSITGGCKCGLVRYSGERLDAPMFRCHCRDCQQLTGTGHSEMVPLLLETFEIGADCTIYRMQGGSGLATYSGFCPTCGAPLTRRSERRKDRIYVHAASLDDPSIYAPSLSICGEAAQGWDGDVIETDG